MAAMFGAELLDLAAGEFKVAGRDWLELISVFETWGLLLVVLRELG